MRITAITPSDENGKRQIFMDDAPFATLGADVVMSLDLHTGDELTEQALDDLLARAESLVALQKAYTYLSYGALSRKKLGEKLRKNEYSEAGIALTLDRLEELGLVDDDALTERLAEVMLSSKHWGPRRRAEELYKRGLVPPREWDTDERAHIRYHMEHKYRAKDLSDPATYRKVAAGLGRLGFDYDDIRAVLGEYKEDWE